VKPISENDLQAFVDGLLPATRHAEVAAYLGEHPAEAARIGDYAAQRDAVRVAYAPVLDEAVPADLDIAALVAARRDGRWGRGMGFARRAAAVLALLMFGGVSGWQLNDWNRPPDAGLPALVREAAASYAVYAGDRQRPVEIGADDSAALNDWVSTRLGHRLAAPDLSQAGFSLIGGRVVPTDHGPAGLFLYGMPGGTRIAVLVRPMGTVDRDARMRLERHDGLAGYVWADDGIGYGVVGTLPATMLHPIADTARQQARGI